MPENITPDSDPQFGDSISVPTAGDPASSAVLKAIAQTLLDNTEFLRLVAESAVQPGDLAAVATSGAYGDLSGQPPRLAEQAIPANPDLTEESGWTTEGTPVSSEFTRASQAWDGSGLVPPDTMRVFGRDTKSPVVLIEGQQTNYARDSADLTQWNLRNADGVYLPDIGPAGPWFRITTDITSGLTDIFRAVGGSGLPETGVFVFSLFVRKRTQSGQNMVMRLNGTNNPAVTVNPQTGEIVLLGSGALDAFVQDYGDSWRISLIYERVEGDTSTSLIIFPFSGSSSGTGTLDIAGPQLEVAPFASSYIPTDGAPATRANEVQYISGLNIPKRGVTVSFAWHALRTLSTLKEAFHLRDESSSDYVALRTSSTGGTERIETAVDGIVLSAASVISDWAAHTVVIEDDGRLTRYANGELIGTTAPVGWLEGNWSRLSLARSQSFFNVWEPIAPGAAQLGIPFIDNRAWSAAEIQAAHARWLPELEKIEVPV